jgi:hypothetical protein
MISLAKDLIKYLVLAGVIAYLLLGVVRPLLKTMLPPPAEEATVGGKIDVLAEEEGEEREQEHVPTAAELLEKARQGTRTGERGPATGSQHHQGMDGCQWQLTTASRRAPYC